MSERTGDFITQPNGFKAFIPKPLPPKPKLNLDSELILLLSNANRNLARLDGITTVLPNPDLFIAMYVKKEALLSSQIEGTQVSLEGVLEFEEGLFPREEVNEVREVVNYVKAMNYGLERLNSLPLSLRLIKEIHAVLVEGARGKNKQPGEFRTSQNWIGTGSSINDAVYIPPPPNTVIEHMGELEKYIYNANGLDPLIKIALIHAQFETIHPFLDGNGRVGRLLITFFLVWKKIISKPLLYLSFYLKKNRQKYYDLLMDVRKNGSWEIWVKFFLEGVAETSWEAANTAKEILMLRETCLHKIYENEINSIHAIRLIDWLFENPLIKSKDIASVLKVSKDTAINLISRLESIGILKEITGKKRFKAYLFQEYVNLIARGTELG